MNKGSFWRLLLISCLSMLMVACKPSAEFSVSPTPVIAGAAATFDASETTIYNTHKGNAAVSYSWDFGDGVTGSGKVVQHTYAAAGTYQVKLSVKDKAGQTGTVSHAVMVQAATATAPIRVVVQLAGGVPLPGALVQVGSATGISNNQGVATLVDAPTGADQVVKASKTGYVTQSVRATLAAGTEAQQVLVLLMPEKDTLSIADIAQAQTIRSNHLGASVTLPANALVNAATGALATGPATLKLTPWDIAGIDLQAMPGNGRALDRAGNVVDLISAGMMTVDFFDAAGNKLQLAAGQSAVIRMDLPAGTTHIGDTPVAAGSTIPLWHFDEARGLWIGEGMGTVVAAANGLAVSGTVEHFSTWNWDYVAPPVVGGSGSGSGGGASQPSTTPTLTVSCVDASDALVACNLVATIQYDAGFDRVWNTSLPAAVTAVRNMPANTTIHWEATTVEGLKGSADSTNTGNVVIRIQPPTTSNFVQCVAPGNVPMACSVQMTTTLANGSSTTLTRYIPDTGATIITLLDTIGSLNWTAQTGFTDNGNGTWTRYNGNATSNVTGTVSIVLAPQVVTTGKTVLVSCDPNATSLSGASVALATCEINIGVADAEGVWVTSFRVPSGLGGPVPVQLPALTDGATIYFSASGTPQVPTVDAGYHGDLTATLGALTQDQSIVLVLRAMDFAQP